MIRYVVGDATAPIAKPAIIAHVVNDVGGWGAGFVLAVSRRWRGPEAAYREWAAGGGLVLGKVQLVPVETTGHLIDVGVANMCAQHAFGDADGPPIRYDALAECFEQLRELAHRYDASIHMPRVGCGLAGGSWDRVEPLIKQQLQYQDVYVYDLPRSK